MILRIKHCTPNTPGPGTPIKLFWPTCNIGGPRHGPLVDGWCSICKLWAGGARPNDSVEGDY